MNAKDRSTVFRNLMLSMWGLLTLVLLFSVFLLVNEMVKAGRDPLSALRSAPEPAASETVPRMSETGLGTREITLCFASSDGWVLVPQRYNIEYTDSTVENCRTALHALIAGPRDVLSPILPSNVKVRALYLLDEGELVVDLSREIIATHTRFKSASLEALMVYGIVNTLTQAALQVSSDPAVRQLRFLFEGAPPPDSFPGHIDLNEAVRPDMRWVESVMDRPPHG
jgi:spore germination protein GerM